MKCLTLNSALASIHKVWMPLQPVLGTAGSLLNQLLAVFTQDPIIKSHKGGLNGARNNVETRQSGTGEREHKVKYTINHTHLRGKTRQEMGNRQRGFKIRRETLNDPKRLKLDTSGHCNKTLCTLSCFF